MSSTGTFQPAATEIAPPPNPLPASFQSLPPEIKRKIFAKVHLQDKRFVARQPSRVEFATGNWEWEEPRWYGRGMNALFLVSRGFGELAAEYVFGSISSERTSLPQFQTNVLSSWGQHIHTLRFSSPGKFDRSSESKMKTMLDEVAAQTISTLLCALSLPNLRSTTLPMPLTLALSAAGIGNEVPTANGTDWVSIRSFFAKFAAGIERVEMVGEQDVAVVASVLALFPKIRHLTFCLVPSFYSTLAWEKPGLRATLARYPGLSHLSIRVLGGGVGSVKWAKAVAGSLLRLTSLEIEASQATSDKVWDLAEPFANRLERLAVTFKGFTSLASIPATTNAATTLRPRSPPTPFPSLKSLSVKCTESTFEPSEATTEILSDLSSFAFPVLETLDLTIPVDWIRPIPLSDLFDLLALFPSLKRFSYLSENGTTVGFIPAATLVSLRSVLPPDRDGAVLTAVRDFEFLFAPPRRTGPPLSSEAAEALCMEQKDRRNLARYPADLAFVMRVVEQAEKSSDDLTIWDMGPLFPVLEEIRSRRED